MSASHWQLDNLIALVDVNKPASRWPQSRDPGFRADCRSLAGFWLVHAAGGGNDIAALQAAFDAARNWSEPQPRVILCDTRMGKAVPFLESR